jgi:hypothetical protein
MDLPNDKLRGGEQKDYLLSRSSLCDFGQLTDYQSAPGQANASYGTLIPSEEGDSGRVKQHVALRAS